MDKRNTETIEKAFEYYKNLIENPELHLDPDYDIVPPEMYTIIKEESKQLNMPISQLFLYLLYTGWSYE